MDKQTLRAEPAPPALLPLPDADTTKPGRITPAAPTAVPDARVENPTPCWPSAPPAWPATPGCWPAHAGPPRLPPCSLPRRVGAFLGEGPAGRAPGARHSSAIPG